CHHPTQKTVHASVITGIGVVSPNGVGCEAFELACRHGKSGVTRLNHIDTKGLKSSVAAQVHDFDPLSLMDVGELRRVPRMIPLALAASREAMQMARREVSGLQADRIVKAQTRRTAGSGVISAG